MNGWRRTESSAWITWAVVVVLLAAWGYMIGSGRVEQGAWRMMVAWLVPIAGVIALLLWKSRGMLAVILRRKGGPRPQWVTEDRAGNLQGRCAKCDATVVMKKGKPGDVAYHCESCGEISHWTEPPEGTKKI